MEPTKRLFILCLSAILLLNQFFATEAYATATETSKSSETGKDSEADKDSKTDRDSKTRKKDTWPEGPSVNAESAILMDLSSGAILYEKNAHKAQYPASITKIMTTLLAIENCSMGEIVTFSHDAVFGIETGSSHIGIDEGEKLTIEQSLYAIMLASANEVSWGVGEHIAGSLSAFADMMNERARELGCQNTQFVNANGLHDDDHYTTVYDMALIAREAMKYNTFRKITATRSYTIPPTNKHNVNNCFTNHHEMLMGNKYPQYKYEYCIGGKTGYTSKAGNTLVTFAKKDDMELVCVVMRANGPASPKNEYTDTSGLFNWAFESFTQYDIHASVKELEDSDLVLFNKYNPIFDSENTPLYLSSTSVLLPNGTDLGDAVRNVEIYSDAKLQEGENIIGNISYTYNGKIVGNTDIIFRSSDVKKLTTAEPIKEVETSSIRTMERYNLKPFIIAAIFILIAACIIAYFYFTKRKKRRKKYRLRF